MDKVAHCLFEQSGTFKIILEPLNIVKYKTVANCWDKVERSIINPQYANRFIREFIL